MSSCTTSEPSKTDKNLGGLVHSARAEPPAIDVSRAAGDADELLRAVLMPHRQVGDALGPHRFQSTSRMEMHEGQTLVEDLTVETTIELGEGGAFHALSKNSRDYGREVYFTDGHLYLAPRYSKFHRREPEAPDEPAALRDDMFGELGAHLDLVARAIAVEDRGALDHGGRSGRKIAVTRAAKARPARPGKGPSLPQHAWRDQAVVDTVTGEIVLDSATGVPLHATLRGTVTFQRDERTFTMTFAVDHAITAIGQPVTITAPGEDLWVATPLRSREVDERDDLLQGIAPPARRAGSQVEPGAAQGGNP